IRPSRSEDASKRFRETAQPRLRPQLPGIRAQNSLSRQTQASLPAATHVMSTFPAAARSPRLRDPRPSARRPRLPGTQSCPPPASIPAPPRQARCRPTNFPVAMRQHPPLLKGKHLAAQILAGPNPERSSAGLAIPPAANSSPLQFPELITADRTETHLIPNRNQPHRFSIRPEHRERRPPEQPPASRRSHRIDCRLPPRDCYASSRHFV